MKLYYVYILAHKPFGALYVGLTNDIYERTRQHKLRVGSKHASKYSITMLVYYEEFDDHHDAFLRERQIKKYRREWKINLIESMNPEWNDLFREWKED